MEIKIVDPRYTLLVEFQRDLPLESAFAGLERELIVNALRLSEGSRTSAAYSLYMNRTTFVMKMKKYGIEFPQKSRKKDICSS